MPTGDWQFWVVSAIALGAVLWIARSLARVMLPRKRRRGAQKRATLTVGGKPVDRSKGGGRPGS